ncbi:thioredoxin-like 4, chloroplastic [Vicia villosa]|uniref:thioredoxin-like 4, chloroplastic n=1 Tax=Vicia villosa TaxID=3911 RepID=UPI00273B5E61|nr:thioredoxin-like 4, chloroplastic [Vicia villosa]XP_058786204.1 thioredoxin-like 4, chloroplastic [Vicia villosa]
MSLVANVIPRQNILHTNSFLSVRLDLYLNKPLLSRISHLVFSSVRNYGHEKLCLGGIRIEPVMKIGHDFFPGKIGVAVDEYQQDVPDEDDDVCPVECVREFKTDEEFCKILEKSKGTETLIVVDFFRTSCGSCRYIEQGFAKLCKKSGSHDAPVMFLKHNVIDEYDEESEVADRLRIRAVPLFHFYKDGKLLEAFPTRDKERIIAAILKYSSLEAEDILS